MSQRKKMKVTRVKRTMSVVLGMTVVVVTDRVLNCGNINVSQ
jgi:hypothetical protein